MRRRIAHGLTIASLIVGLGAAQGPNISEAKSAPGSSNPQPEVRKPAKATKPAPYAVGTASWYGEFFNGKETASGEPYDMYDMTAASLTIPLGTYVKVTNLRNGREVVVRVNDRGPVVAGRIIDLSYGAASALRFTSRGLQRVRLDLVNPTPITLAKANVAKTTVASAAKPKPHYQTVAANLPAVAQLP